MSVDRNITGNDWLGTMIATGGVIISGAGTLTMNAARTLDANVPLTIGAGCTLNTANFQQTFGGNFINTGTFTAGSSSIIISGGAAVQSIAGFTTTGTVSMTKTGGTATLTGNVNGGGLTINGIGGALNLGTSLTHTFSGNWNRTIGIVEGNTSMLRIAGNVFGVTGTFNAGTGTVEYNGSGAQTLGPQTTYNNLIFSGSATKTLVAAITTTGTLTVSSGTTFATADFGVTLVGDFSNSGTVTAGSSAITFNGTANQSIASFTTTGTVSMTKTGGTATLIGAVNGGVLTINGIGGTLNLGTSLTHTFTGNWNITQGTVEGNTSTLKIAGSVTVTSGAFTAGTGTVEYNGVGAGQPCGVLTYNNLILSA